MLLSCTFIHIGLFMGILRIGPLPAQHPNSRITSAQLLGYEAEQAEAAGPVERCILVHAAKAAKNKSRSVPNLRI